MLYFKYIDNVESNLSCKKQVLFLLIINLQLSSAANKKAPLQFGTLYQLYITFVDHSSMFQILSAISM